MGSGYFGEPNLGSSSGRRSKKISSNSDKPKQPQRGLGVAQLEKIRLHTQMGSSSSSTSYLNPPPPPPSLHHHIHPYYNSPNLNQDDMRLQTGYSSSSSSSFSYAFPVQQNIVMGLSDLERGNIRYGDSQPANSTRWPPGNPFLDGQQFTEPNMTRQLLDRQAGEDSFEKRRTRDGTESYGSSSHNSESSGHQDLDLELRLSL